MSLTDRDVQQVQSIVGDMFEQYDEHVTKAIVTAVKEDRLRPEARDQITISPATVNTLDQLGNITVTFDTDPLGAPAAVGIFGTAAVGQRGQVFHGPAGSSYFVGMTGTGGGGGPTPPPGKGPLFGSQDNLVNADTSLTAYDLPPAWVLRTAHGTQDAPAVVNAGDDIGVYAFDALTTVGVDSFGGPVATYTRFASITGFADSQTGSVGGVGVGLDDVVPLDSNSVAIDGLSGAGSGPATGGGGMIFSYLPAGASAPIEAARITGKGEMWFNYDSTDVQPGLFKAYWYDGVNNYPSIMQGPAGNITVFGIANLDNGPLSRGTRLPISLFNTYRNTPGMGDITLGGGIMFGSSYQIVADGVTITTSGPGFDSAITIPPGSPAQQEMNTPRYAQWSTFVDDPYYTAINGGHLDYTSNGGKSIGSWTLPVWVGAADFDSRLDWWAWEIAFFPQKTNNDPLMWRQVSVTMTQGSATIAGNAPHPQFLATDVGYRVEGDGIPPNTVVTSVNTGTDSVALSNKMMQSGSLSIAIWRTPSVGRHVAFKVDALRAADENRAVQASSPIELWPDTYTHWKVPSDTADFHVGASGDMFLDFPNARFGTWTGFNGTIQFKQDANQLAMSSGFVHSAIYKNARRTIVSCSLTNGSAVLTSLNGARAITAGSAEFGPGDVGATIKVQHLFDILTTTIASVQSLRQITLATTWVGQTTTAATAIITNQARLGPSYDLFFAPTYEADGITMTNSIGMIGTFVRPIFSTANSGIMNVTGHNGAQYGATVNPGVTLLARSGIVINDATGGGHIGAQNGLVIDHLTAGDNNIGILNRGNMIIDLPESFTAYAVPDPDPTVNAVKGTALLIQHDMTLDWAGDPFLGPVAYSSWLNPWISPLLPPVRTTSADGHCTTGSTTITSASAAFTNADLGAQVSSNVGGHLSNGNTYITAVTGPTQATISQPAIGTGTTDAFRIFRGDYGTSPQGPRGQISLEGTTTWNFPGKLLGGPGEMFTAWQIYKNKPGVAMNIGGNVMWELTYNIIADGAAVGLVTVPDVCAPNIAPEDFTLTFAGWWGLTDNPVFSSINGGQLNAPNAVSVGFLPQAMFMGNVQFGERRDIFVRECWMRPGIQSQTNIMPTLTKHVGIYMERMTAAAKNLAIVVNNGIQAFNVDRRYTSNPFAGLGGFSGAWLSFENKFTLDYANPLMGSVFSFSPTIELAQSANPVGLIGVYSSQALLQNKSGVQNLGLGGITVVLSNNTHNANNATVSGGPSRGLHHTPNYTVTGSGLFTGFTTNAAVECSLTVNAGALVTDRYGLKFNDASAGAFNSHRVTHQYGVWVDLMLGADHNFGIYNGSTTMYPGFTTNITAAGNTIAILATTMYLNNTTGGPVTMTAIPTFVSGEEGQVVTVVNTGSDTITLQDQATLFGSNLKLLSPTVTLAQSQAMSFVYNSNTALWIQTSGAAGTTGVPVYAFRVDGTINTITSGFGVYGSRTVGKTGFLTLQRANTPDPSALAVGDAIQSIQFVGYNSASANYLGGAFIQGVADEGYTVANHWGARLEFGTTANGSGNNPVIRTVIDNQGTLWHGGITQAGGVTTAANFTLTTAGVSTFKNFMTVQQSTIGLLVRQLISGTTAGQQPIESLYQGRVLTTTNAQSTVATIAVNTNATYMIQAHVVARRTDATNTGDALGSVVLATVKGSTTTPAIVGNVATLGTPNTAFAANFFAMQQQSNTWAANTAYVTITISGTNALVRVTGVTGANLTWHATVRVWTVST